MELEPIDDRQTEAEMWIEVDLGGIMRAIPGSILKVRIQRVSDQGYNRMLWTGLRKKAAYLPG
jgi:hypothetical protein